MSRKDLFLLDKDAKLADKFRPPINKIINFTWDGTTAGGTQFISGVGFKGEIFNFDSVEIAGAHQSEGHDNLTTHACFYRGAAGNFEFTGDYSIRVYESGGQVLQGYIDSVTDDGFYIKWFDSGTFAATVRVISVITRQ